MRAWQILIGVGAIVLLIGIGVAAGSANPLTAAETLEIRAGAEWYVFYEFNVLGGRLEASFTESQSQAVDVFLYGEAEYTAYVAGSYPTNVYSATASAGTIDVTLPRGGRYYLVFEHGPGLDGTAQTITTSIKVSGIDPTPLGIGLVVLAIGALLLAFGYRSKRREARMPPRFPGAAPGPATMYGPPGAGAPGTFPVPPGAPGMGPPTGFAAPPPVVPSSTAPRGRYCPTCGTRYPAEQMVCSNDMTELRDEPL
jgi:hypothetical protein